MKLGNFGSFDPSLHSRGISGLTRASKADRVIWDEFNSDWENLAIESELTCLISSDPFHHWGNGVRSGDLRCRFRSLFFLVSASRHRRRAPSVTIAQPPRFEFQGVKYSRVECKRTALWCERSAELLGESDEKPFRPADVAEPIRVFILDHFAHELRAALAEPLKRLVDVVHGEHDA